MLHMRGNHRLEKKESKRKGKRAQEKKRACGSITFVKTAHELGLSSPGGLLRAGFLAERAEQAALSLAEHQRSDARLFLALLPLALPVKSTTTGRLRQ